MISLRSMVAVLSMTLCFVFLLGVNLLGNMLVGLVQVDWSETYVMCRWMKGVVDFVMGLVGF
jgi:hypothetical protein